MGLCCPVPPRELKAQRPYVLIFRDTNIKPGAWGQWAPQHSQALGFDAAKAAYEAKGKQAVASLSWEKSP